VGWGTGRSIHYVTYPAKSHDDVAGGQLQTQDVFDRKL